MSKAVRAACGPQKLDPKFCEPPVGPGGLLFVVVLFIALPFTQLIIISHNLVRLDPPIQIVDVEQDTSAIPDSR